MYDVTYPHGKVKEVCVIGEQGLNVKTQIFL